MKLFVAAASSTVALAACSPTTDYTMTNGGADNPVPVGQVKKQDFEQANVGQLPADFIHVLGDWSVEQDGSSRVLKQKGDYHNDDFPRVVLKDSAFTNVHVKARCRAEGGSTDQACGLMWRFQDSDNYYLTRANALEGNVRLYKVVKGSREQFDTKDTPVSSNEWHTLEAMMEGTHIKIIWNGAVVMDTNDGTFGKGKVGLWTKADSITSFDDFEAKELEGGSVK